MHADRVKLAGQLLAPMYVLRKRKKTGESLE
jgi:hypothetical protein